MASFLQDLRYALHSLAKAPLFTAVALLSLSLGIGANTAIFTLVDQVLLRLLPVKDPEKLVMVYARGPHYGSNNGSYRMSYPMFLDFQKSNEVFDGMFCGSTTAMSLSADGRTERVVGEYVSGSFFPVLGVGPAAGRVFTSEDDRTRGGHPYAVLSESYWKTRFNRDPNVIGKKIIVNSYPLTIIGVSQAGFDGTNPGYSPQIRVPIVMKLPLEPDSVNAYDLDSRRGRWITVFGRLKPNVSVEKAKASLEPYFHQMLEMEVQQKEFAKADQYTKQQFLKMYMNVTPASTGNSQLRKQFSTPLLVLSAVVALVLLIACANMANLLIARASARQKEIAVRLSVGASRAIIVRQLLVESILLSLLGGAGGLLLAVVLDRVLITFLPQSSQIFTLSTTPDLRILAFTLEISVLTGLLFGLVPALQSTRPDLASILKDQGGGVTSSAHVGVRKALVAAQVTLSLLLLVGAGLFLRSLANLKNVDPGFHTSNLLTFKLNPNLNGYHDDRGRQYYRDLTRKLRTIPGVSQASLCIMPVLEGNEWDSSMTIDSYHAKQGENVGPHMNFLTSGYFASLDIPLLAGRDFNEGDEKNAPKVAIVNHKFAQRYFGDTNPIGHHIGMGSDPGTVTDITVVGVVGDTRYEDLREDIPVEVYIPYQQLPIVLGMTAYIRATGDPLQLSNAVRRVVAELDPNVPVFAMHTLEAQVADSLLTERLVATLSAAFGLLATLLAAIGLYGVMAYTTSRRTREIGLRMALGANTGNVLWLVMREVLLLAGVGSAVGLVLAMILSRWIKSQLYGIAPTDPSTIILATIGIILTAVLAGYAPAHRAAKIDPMRALRWE